VAGTLCEDLLDWKGCRILSVPTDYGRNQFHRSAWKKRFQALHSHLSSRHNLNFVLLVLVDSAF
jgi:hypothetical protein